MDTKKLRQKILDLAIRGKLVLQDPNDEPASVLLERIKAEKERLIKEGKIKRNKKTAKTSDTPHYENVPFDVPESWVWCKIEDIGEVITGNTPSKDKVEYYGGNIPFFKPTDLEQGIDTKFASDHLSELGFEQSRKLPVNTILVTCIGATIGKTGITTVAGSCNQQINAIVPNWYVTHSFIYYVCISDYMQIEIKSNASATTLPILNKGNFSNLLFPLPPLAEQHRIVAEIERWFSLIDTIEISKDDLQATIKQAKSKILDLAIHGKLVPQDPNDEPAIELLKRINPDFTSCDNGHYTQLPFETPQNWCWTTLGKIGKWQSGSTPNRLNKDYYNGNIPWLKTGDLNDGYITHIPESITEKALNETSVKLNPTGSVLIAMYGATIGKIGILTFPATTNQACCACEVFNGIDKEFLFLFLLSHREEFIKMGGGGAQPNISKEKIINTYIPLPPFAEQKRIVNTVNVLFTKLDDIMESL